MQIKRMRVESDEAECRSLSFAAARTEDVEEIAMAFFRDTAAREDPMAMFNEKRGEVAGIRGAHTLKGLIR